MTAVVTKVSWNQDYDDFEEWVEDMEILKDNLKQEFAKRYNNANPFILAISQDLTLPKREENKQGTPQNTFMKE